MQPCRPHGARLSRVDGALHPGLRVKISLSMLVLIYSSSSRTMLPRSPAPIRQRSQCAILQVFTKSIEVLYSVLNTELSRFCSAASLLGTACASAPAGGAHLQGAQLHLLCDARRDRRRPVTAEPAATRISRRHHVYLLQQGEAVPFAAGQVEAAVAWLDWLNALGVFLLRSTRCLTSHCP